MPFAVETQLGPYKIIALIGAGGMGEVYRARDTRLLRDVALKVLPASFTKDPERVRRFEQEARAVAALNHPNIVSVHDVGASDGVHYIVSELLEGETLRQRITPSGMPARKAVELAIQLANGLAAAHEQNIIHRDLKPENIFITRNGRLKILDFGLAKLRRIPGTTENFEGATITDTEAGQVMGTVGYMSPEQVKCEAADHRSDIFSFGSILYEMLGGSRAFKCDTSAETMTAILNEEPPEFAPRTGVAPALDRIVRHCIEKQPSQRFQSAHDIAFALESLSGISQPAAVPVSASHRRWIRAALPALLLLAAGLALVGWLRPWLALRANTLAFHRLTYRHGTSSHARFAPDGETVVYAAAWEGSPVEVFSGRLDSPESRPLGIPGADLFAISQTGELAVQLRRTPMPGFSSIGTLARLPLSGGGVREVLDGVEYADWSPKGELAVVRQLSGMARLEFPVNKVLYESAGWIGDARFSPEGDVIAFLDHPVLVDDGADVAIVDLRGNKKTLSRNWTSAQGLAWSPNGKEIWFTANRANSARRLQAVSLTGRERTVYAGPTTLNLHDIAPNGRVLFARLDTRTGTVVVNEGQKTAHDLSWHDWSIGRQLSPDGSTLLISESGEAVGADYVCYVRKTDGSPAIRLGEGHCTSFTPDGKWVLSFKPLSAPSDVFLLPVGPGEPRRLHLEGGLLVTWPVAVPDGKRLLILGHYPSHGTQIFVQDLSGGPPRAISAEGNQFRFPAFSPDGAWVAGNGKDRTAWLFSLTGGQATLVRGSEPGDRPTGFSSDGKYLFVSQLGETSVKIDRIDVVSGQRSSWKVVRPSDPTGITYMSMVEARDNIYAYFYNRTQSDLYVVDGLR